MSDEESVDVPALIYANKQDLPNAILVSEIIEKLELMTVHKERKWYIQKSNALTNEGLDEGMKWLSRNY